MTLRLKFVIIPYLWFLQHQFNIFVFHPFLIDEILIEEQLALGYYLYFFLT